MNLTEIVASLPVQEIQHMERVGRFVDVIASRLAAFCEVEKYLDEAPLYGPAAAYHDIGKAWVPKNILTKPGALTEEEIKIIRKHPCYACEFFSSADWSMISSIPEYIRLLTYDSAVYHQEWWDGNGYPYGISGNSIPYIARLTAVCDAYDAITHERYYRPSQSHEYACHELDLNAGTQFDPEIVRVFLQCEEEICMMNRQF